MPTLLVVDDEPSVLHVFSLVFTRESMTLLTAPSGGEGLELFFRDRAMTRRTVCWRKRISLI